MLNKIVRIGTVKTWGGRNASVYCKVEFDRDGKRDLSISGVVGPTRGGNAMGGCGQIDMEFEHRNPEQNDKRYSDLIKPADIRFAAGWDADRWYEFLEIWKTWHLNDTHAECVHQEERGETWEKNPSAVCPECGWKLGHGWSRREVPESVIKFLSELPDADRQPAWV